jgi:hypothetical protein
MVLAPASPVYADATAKTNARTRKTILISSSLQQATVGSSVI